MNIKMDIKRGIEGVKREKFGSFILIILTILFVFGTAAAETCTYSLSPTNQSFSSNGGTDTISVTTQSGCSWTLAVTLDWVSITSGISGTGSGTVTYSVLLNDTGQPRKGTITIGNQTFTIRQAKSVFNDVTDPAYWAYPYIYAIYTEGITVGCGNNNYCPDDAVTRGQMAAFIIRALYGENFTYTQTPYFSDVPSTHGFFKYVQKLRDDGITAVNGTYSVDSYVTRGQMAAFIIRAKYGENFTYTESPYFSDVPSTHGFFKYVQKLKDDGITTVTGTYDVDSVVTREQMAAFLTRAFLETPAGNQPPSAVPGPDQEVVQGNLVVLDGSWSSDPDGDIVSYRWTQTSGPSVELIDSMTDTAIFIAPQVGQTGENLVFNLTVTDNQGLTDDSSVTVRVTQVEESPPPTSIQLIAQALDEGRIDEGTALIYKAFLFFGDSRLPTEYTGAVSNLGRGVIVGIVEKFPTLSDEQKQVLQPFLLPPDEPGSWYTLDTVRGSNAAAAASTTFVSVASLNGKVRINYSPTDVANGPTLAEGLRAAIDTKIWDKLKDLMATEPLPPPAGHDRLDVFLIPRLSGATSDAGATVPYSGCKQSPAYIEIVVTPTTILGDETHPGLIQYLAHEMMHAWQYRYPLKDACETYNWVAEATAVWTEDYVYPNANSENHYAERYLNTVGLSLDDTSNPGKYGARE